MTSDLTGPNTTLTIDQEFSSSDGTGFRDFTGFLFTSAGGFDFEYGGSFLDEGASVFFVNPDDAFSEATILGNTFTELSLGTVYPLPSRFFLGIRTPAIGVEFGALPPAYGWAELENTGTGELVLIDHAVAYHGEGIVVDSLSAIPEPGSGALGAVAVGLLCLRRNGRRGHQGRSMPHA